MASIPEFYIDATDYRSRSPKVFGRLKERTTNLVAWQQNPTTRYSPELKAYLADLRTSQPETTGIGIEQNITFNNGETLVIPFDQALIRPGYEHLKKRIQIIGNALIDNAGAPISFLTTIEEGKGQSSLRFLSHSDILERIQNPKTDDLFHLDGLLNAVPEVTTDTPDSPSLAITVITDLLDSRRTQIVKGEFVDEVTRETLQQLQDCGPKKSTWNDAVEEVGRRTGQRISQELRPGEVGVFAIMPRGVRGRDVYEAPTRVYGLHRAPELQESDQQRLTLVLRAQIGGFTPRG